MSIRDFRVTCTLSTGEVVPVGMLLTGAADPSGAFRSAFRYDATWLSRNDAFPLDPNHLPLIEREFRSTNLTPPFGVFEDSLPDDWGRKMLAAIHQLPRSAQSLPTYLSLIGQNTMGALRYADTRMQLQSREGEDALSLDELYQAANDLENGRMLSPNVAIHRLLGDGASPGGARPKALIYERDDNGMQTHWVAKFPSIKDGSMDVPGLEATCLTLALGAGLNVPRHRLTVAGSKRILLVERFDISPAGGRYHMISLKSLYGERPGVYANEYRELRDLVRRYSAAPDEDVELLFRHMVFNGCIGNTDDHLKNFWMRQTEIGLRLSPSFDLVPDIANNREHRLAFEYDRTAPASPEMWANIGSKWGVSNPDDIVSQVFAAAGRFASVAQGYEVNQQSIDQFESGITARTLATSDPDTGITGQKSTRQRPGI